MRATPRAVLLAGLILALAPAPGHAFTLDALNQALPPHPCLPLSMQPVVFVGPYCDGTSCPPDPLAACSQGFADQTGASGVWAGAPRRVSVGNYYDEPTSARLDPVAHVVEASFGGTSESTLGLEYGTPYDFLPEPGALNLNLVALGATDVQLVLQGGISTSQPLLVAVEFLSDAPQAPRPSATALVVVDQPGIVSIPLSAFVPMLGFSMSDMDDIQIFVSTCLDWENGCDGSTYAPVAFSVGPIEIVTSPTAARRASWGALKQLYR